METQYLSPHCLRCSITSICMCDELSLPVRTIVHPSIPKVIVQTGKTAKDMPQKNKWRTANPSYAYKFFDDEACIRFLLSNFGMRATLAFVKLRPGAFKADLFRYAYLYVHGGVYIDIDCVPVFGCTLDQILNKNTHLVSVSDRRNIPGIWQAFIACVPGIKELKTAVEQICLHVEHRWYPTIPVKMDPWPSILSISGPVLLANALGGQGIHTQGFHMLKDGKTSIYLYCIGNRGLSGPVLTADGRAIMLCTTPDYIKHGRESYETFVYEKKVYKETIDESTLIRIKKISSDIPFRVSRSRSTSAA